MDSECEIRTGDSTYGPDTLGNKPTTTTEFQYYIEFYSDSFIEQGNAYPVLWNIVDKAEDGKKLLFCSVNGDGENTLTYYTLDDDVHNGEYLMLGPTPAFGPIQTLNLYVIPITVAAPTKRSTVTAPKGYTIAWNKDTCGYGYGEISDTVVAGTEQDVINACAIICSRKWYLSLPIEKDASCVEEGLHACLENVACQIAQAYYYESQKTGRCAL